MGGSKMLKQIKGLISEEEGISTVEIVVIIAILVGIALLFRKSITAYVQKVISNFIDTAPTVENLEVDMEAPLPKD
jgi:hypothetical protein